MYQEENAERFQGLWGKHGVRGNESKSRWSFEGRRPVVDVEEEAEHLNPHAEVETWLHLDHILKI